jgi:hypothetical protein
VLARGTEMLANALAAHSAVPAGREAVTNAAVRSIHALTGHS